MNAFQFSSARRFIPRSKRATSSRRTAGALMARLGPVMQRAGYDPVPVPRQTSRADAIKQFGAAARLAARPVEGNS